MKGLAQEFRDVLGGYGWAEAAIMVAKYPCLLDRPVYGDTESALRFYSVGDASPIVSWLLKQGANPNGVDPKNYPLHESAAVGNADVCRLLLSGGADPNLKDFIGETALHKASSGGYVSIVEMLLKSGADPAIVEMCGERPVDQALPRKVDEVRAAFETHSRRSDSKA